jgi:hypothetical protein
MEYGQPGEQEPRAELDAVAQAAGARLRAHTEADDDGVRAASEQLLAAATAAMTAGCALGDIAAAEIRGQRDVRDELRGDALRRVERTGERARQARADHHGEIVRSIRLGLSTREIAAAAGVTHGTIRAIGNRTPAEQTEEPPREEEQQEWHEGHHGEGENQPWGEY